MQLMHLGRKVKVYDIFRNKKYIPWSIVLWHCSRQLATKPSLPNPSEAVLFENSTFA
jgi:hypothetical protein